MLNAPRPLFFLTPLSVRIFRSLTAIGCLLALAYAKPAGAEEYLSAEPMDGKKVRIDGMLRDWPGGFVKLRGQSKLGGEALVGYDKEHLYLAASIEDSKIVRTQ